jgi:hypothetical protein
MTENTVTSDAPLEIGPFHFRKYGMRAGMSVLLGIIGTTYLWDIWTSGVSALGFNATVFVLVFLALLGLGTENKTLFRRNQLAWIFPFILIALSFSLYETSFFKSVNIFVFPLVLAWFYNYGMVLDKENLWFDRIVIQRVFLRSTQNVIRYIRPAFGVYLSWVRAITNLEEDVIRRVSLGLIGFCLSVLVVIPLLYTSDELFATKIDAILDWPLSVLSWPTLYKVYGFIVITVTAFASALAWQGSWKLSEVNTKRRVDALISSIVLVGVLLVYGLFIATQVERLWIHRLPIDFGTTERWVKSGFWQLIILTFLNSSFFIFLYRKTNGFVQLLLSAFCLASLLILISAGHRMYLYVTNYGLSDEVFYACYSVVFCAFLLLYLAYVSVTHVKANILKYAMFLFLWMYAAVSIVPVERIIFESNVALAQRSEHINLMWIGKQSTDVLPRAIELVASKELEHKNQFSEYGWRQWIKRQSMNVQKKAWHQHNIGSIIAKRAGTTYLIGRGN